MYAFYCLVELLVSSLQVINVCIIVHYSLNLLHFRNDPSSVCNSLNIHTVAVESKKTGPLTASPGSRGRMKTESSGSVIPVSFSYAAFELCGFSGI